MRRNSSQNIQRPAIWWLNSSKCGFQVIYQIAAWHPMRIKTNLNNDIDQNTLVFMIRLQLNITEPVSHCVFFCGFKRWIIGLLQTNILISGQLLIIQWSLFSYDYWNHLISVFQLLDLMETIKCDNCRAENGYRHFTSYFHSLKFG